ncbi:MAG: GNAT family N-acetyltransferase [Defluviitaleaceae bacterium]|nr:GNAT family N-acetyltransferase [Defluviitaleaceae bacterium]
MTATDTIEIIQLLEKNGIEVYVDGGWGVDALLGRQTRNHSDLDIALPHKFVPLLRSLLEARGYKDVPRDDTRDCNFVLGDSTGRQVDIHSYTFDESGKNIFGVAYEPHHLTAEGVINGFTVKTIPPDVMVEFHTGYDVDAGDYQDVKNLCEKFNIPMPKIYDKFRDAEKCAEGHELNNIAERFNWCRNIKHFCAEDLPACCELYIKVFNNPPWNDKWTKETALRCLGDLAERKRFLGYTLWEDETLVGAIFAHAKTFYTGDEIYIDELFICPSRQRMGYGQMLMAETENFAKQNDITCITLITSKRMAAFDFYKKLGYSHLDSMVLLFRSYLNKEKRL